MSDSTISRRKALALAAGAAGAVATGAKLPKMSHEKPMASLKQSVCRWCFGGIALDDLCVAGKDMGLVGIDLLNEGDFATVKKHGLICTMALGITTIEDGWNRVENHDRFVKDAERLIPIIAENGRVTRSGSLRSTVCRLRESAADRDTTRSRPAGELSCHGLQPGQGNRKVLDSGLPDHATASPEDITRLTRAHRQLR